jgi:pimeloyl-ACP methyl ester carboxylesterase
MHAHRVDIFNRTNNNTVIVFIPDNFHFILLKTNIEPDPSKPNGHRWKPNVQTLSDEYENMLDYYISKPTEWTNPVDVIYGEDSEYVDDASLAGFKKLYRNFTDSNVYPIKHAGHWLHFEQSTQFLADVDDIFKKYKK